LFLTLLTTGITACASNVISPSLPPDTSLTISSSQQLVVDDILTDLKQKGVPVKSASLVNFTEVNPPIEIEFTIQSDSDDDKGIPDDSINSILVYRAANLAQRKGLNIGAIGIVLVNRQGQRINTNISAVTKIDDLPPLASTPSSLEDAAVSNLLKQKISLSALSTFSIIVSQEDYGLREVVFDIQVPDLQTANNNIGVVSSIMASISNLNHTQDARISAFRIYVTDAAGQPLFKLMDDLTVYGGHTAWWQIEGLVNWGYPSPQS
jgi:hypothetical protein